MMSSVPERPACAQLWLMKFGRCTVSETFYVVRGAGIFTDLLRGILNCWTFNSCFRGFVFILFEMGTDKQRGEVMESSCLVEFWVQCF